MNTNTQSEAEHQIAVLVKWHGPTNYRGARISLTLPRWDNKRVFVSFDYSARSMLDQAQYWLGHQACDVKTIFDMGEGQGYLLGVSWSQLDCVLSAFNVKK
jgi:hypothetical protein